MSGRLERPPFVAASAAVPATLGQLTDTAFLDVLFRAGPTSRAAIAKETGISRPTSSESAQRLLGAGIVVEVGQGSGQRGRPTVLYDVNARFGHALGIALERGHVAVRALDFRGDVIADYRVEGREVDVPTAVGRARDLVGKCADQAGSPLRGTAVSIAAPIDPVTGTVRQLADAPFAGTVGGFAEALGLPADQPLRIDNDVNWATIAEHRLGAMQHNEDFLYVYLGAGIGAGLFLSGHIHRGATGFAGEIAFTQLADGQTLMRHLGGSAIGTDDHLGVDVNKAQQLLDRVEDESALATLLDALTRMISNIATVIDPGDVVLGGPLAHTQAFAGDLAARLPRVCAAPLAVSVSSLGHDAPLAGAAIGALELARGNSITK